MRINNAGGFEYCRWAQKTQRNQNADIQHQSPIQWFQQTMQPLRHSMLAGEYIDGCETCYVMDANGKVSGRQKQLLKIGVTVADFEKTMLSSPWLDEFKQTQDQQTCHQWPQDWQIDLGNYCNGACVFCTPFSSSRLASEFKKIGLIKQLPPRAWCDDPALVEKFVETLKLTTRLNYLHFIGGETLITPAFKIILQALIAAGLHKQVSLGFTTNLTVWDQSVVDLLKEFKEINVGLSIECIHPLNDYVRYGGDLQTTMELLERWVKLAKQKSWLTQLRITPTVLSIWHLDTVYEYAINNGVSVESCNFLYDPEFMKPSVLPQSQRQLVIQKLQSWISSYINLAGNTKTINIRHSDFAKQQVVEDAMSYVNYLQTQEDQSHLLPDLVSYLKRLEKNRGNRIIDYLPEYEQLFRTAGY